MKRNITQEELEIIENHYSNDFINVYKNFLNNINNSQFVLTDYLIYFEDLAERFKIYHEGISEDTKSENANDNLNFAIEITHIYLSGKTLIECYKFAIEYSYDLRILNGDKNLIIYFKKIEDKEKRIKNIYSKKYSIGRYFFNKNNTKKFYHPKDVKLYFENLIETLNYHFSALLIKNHFNQYSIIDDLIEEYDQNMCSFGESILDERNKFYLQNSSIFNYLQPIIDAERYCGEYDNNIDDDFYYFPEEATDEECYDVDRTDELKLENFIASYIENNGHIKGNIYKDCYKNTLFHPLPFQMIDYHFLSQRECVNEVIYIYRLSAFVDSYLLHKIFSIYDVIRSYPDLKVKFIVKSLYNAKNKDRDSLLKTTKCNNPYLCTLFRLLPNTDRFEERLALEYNYNNEYINFFFYIIESKNKSTLDYDTYWAEEEEIEKNEIKDRETVAMADDWKKECEDFVKSMDEDFPGWGDGLG